MRRGYGNKVSTQAPSLESHTLDILHEYILGASSDDAHHGLDLRKPHIRPIFNDNFKFIIFTFALIVGIGIIANSLVFVRIIKNKLYKDATHSFVLNNVISDFLKCCFVLPISVYVLIVQNWMLGELMCSFLPMIQDIPFHVTTLTFVLMAWDRLRYVRNPGHPRLPAFVCCFGTWLTSMCLVLPYPLYIIYVDIGKHYPQLEGVGLCILNLADDISEYLRGILITMYVAPLCTISYLYIRVSRELKIRQNSLELQESCGDGGGYNGGCTFNIRQNQRNTRSSIEGGRTMSNESYEYDDEDSRSYEIDALKEKRTQKFLVFTVTFYGICLCPIMIMRLVRLAVMETYENSVHLDITYTIFVWLAYAPTCITPIVYLTWQMSRSSKDRIKGYFQFNDRKSRRSCDTVVTTTGTTSGGIGYGNGGMILTASRKSTITSTDDVITITNKAQIIGGTEERCS